MTPTIVWTLLAVAVVVGIATLILVGRRRAKARKALSEHARPINEECAAGGHAYQTFGTGFRCATCGNHVSSAEGELYGRVEDGRQERRREPR
jgi:cytochrome c-type biogenesis protein CcmH/NrfF